MKILLTAKSRQKMLDPQFLSGHDCWQKASFADLIAAVECRWAYAGRRIAYGKFDD